MITDQHFTGFVYGVGACALGYYLYKQNQNEVDEFLRKQGINLPSAPVAKDISKLTLEELIGEKERLEDIIAERELAVEKVKDPNLE